jgi:hypothetical protein
MLLPLKGFSPPDLATVPGYIDPRSPRCYDSMTLRHEELGFAA